MSERHFIASVHANKSSDTPDTRDTRADTTSARPAKPRPDFPLFSHATGRWAKKVNGKMLYFGPWNDPEGAERRYKEFTKSGKIPPTLSVSKPRKRRRDATHAEAPAKPYPDFPLFPHATKRWAKKIRGHLHYFGPWDDPMGALDRYLKQRDDLHAGRKPRDEAECDEVTVKVVTNKWLNLKRIRREEGRLSPMSFEKYEAVGQMVVKEFGKVRLVADLRPDDFTKLYRKMSSRWGILRLRDQIQHVRSIFLCAFRLGLITRPMNFGPGFDKPDRKAIRMHRAAKGPMLFARDELHAMLDQAGVQLRAMIFLGLNAGLGNADVGKLPLSALDLDTGWLDFPRPKTGVERRCWLWPETVAAIRAALAKRPTPKDAVHAGLAFITKYGEPWGKEAIDNPVSKEFAKLMRKTFEPGRKGLGFYTLRHVFRTIADAAKDQPATNHIMGHAFDDMPSQYRESIGDERLRAVAEHVRTWLYATPAAAQTNLQPEQRAAAAHRGIA
jgi:integrase